MKTLVIVAHPNLETSVVNKRWVEELAKYPDKYTIHDISKVYPDGNIDVEQEQKRIEAHGNLVFQFPVYWFSSPPLLKKWFDEVFTYGWAYGSQGKHLNDRKIALAVSTGIKHEDYQEQGRYHFTLNQVLVPFELTAMYCKANYRSFFAFYGAEFEPSASEVHQSAADYIRFLENI